MLNIVAKHIYIKSFYVSLRGLIKLTEAINKYSVRSIHIKETNMSYIYVRKNILERRTDIKDHIFLKDLIHKETFIPDRKADLEDHISMTEKLT